MKNLFVAFLMTLAVGIKAQTTVQNFTLTNVVDGKTVSLDQFSSNVGVVILFTSNECPFDNYYKDRIKEMIGNYAGKVQYWSSPIRIEFCACASNHDAIGQPNLRDCPR